MTPCQLSPLLPRQAPSCKTFRPTYSKIPSHAHCQSDFSPMALEHPRDFARFLPPRQRLGPLTPTTTLSFFPSRSPSASRPPPLPSSPAPSPSAPVSPRALAPLPFNTHRSSRTLPQPSPTSIPPSFLLPLPLPAPIISMLVHGPCLAEKGLPTTIPCLQPRFPPRVSLAF